MEEEEEIGDIVIFYCSCLFPYHLRFYLFEFLEGFDVFYLAVERQLIFFRSKVFISYDAREFEFYFGPLPCFAGVFEFFDFFLEHSSASTAKRSRQLT